MKFTDEEGKVWEWRGEYKYLETGDYFLTEHKMNVGRYAGVHTGSQRAIVHPVPIIHEFGGVRFEETGERRQVRSGEWFWQKPSRLSQERGLGPWPTYNYDLTPTTMDYVILRPLQGE